jgi:hypothetical protein
MPMLSSLAEITVLEDESGSTSMQRAVSRLHTLLDERAMTPAQLWRRLEAQERAFDIKTVYRLADPSQPLLRLDLRLAGAICHVLGIRLDELIVFAEPTDSLESLPPPKQQRLDALLDRHDDGALSPEELAELGDLVAEAEQVALTNARRLAERRQSQSGTSDTQQRRVS